MVDELNDFITTASSLVLQRNLNVGRGTSHFFYDADEIQRVSYTEPVQTWWRAADRPATTARTPAEPAPQTPPRGLPWPLD